jgi:hypothetical protein
VPGVRPGLSASAHWRHSAGAAPVWSRMSTGANVCHRTVFPRRST